MSDPIVFDRVTRRFGGQEVLKEFSLSVKQGEIYALLGRNGAGKTTALSILMGFLRPMSGEARLLGERSDELTDAARLNVGLVTEGAPMIGWMTVQEAVAFEAGTRPNFDRKHALDTLARLSIPLDKKIKSLSKGMAAQLALVFAMAGDPKVLVLDDPAMGLDAVMRREFLEAMVDLLGREGRSVLFSSHILPDVERMADRVGILHGGRIVLEAPLVELKQRVTKRFVEGAYLQPIDLTGIPGLVTAKLKREGAELVLADQTEERTRELAKRFPALSQPIVPTLEELFIDVTSGEIAGPFTAGGIS
jgi:ABC-2 type transport system ATP-binding protein